MFEVLVAVERSWPENGKVMPLQLLLPSLTAAVVLVVGLPRAAGSHERKMLTCLLPGTWF